MHAHFYICGKVSLRVSRTPTTCVWSLLLHHDEQHVCTCVDTQEKITHSFNWRCCCSRRKSARVVPQKKLATRAPKSPFRRRKALRRTQHCRATDQSNRSTTRCERVVRELRRGSFRSKCATATTQLNAPRRIHEAEQEDGYPQGVLSLRSHMESQNALRRAVATHRTTDAGCRRQRGPCPTLLVTTAARRWGCDWATVTTPVAGWSSAPAHSAEVRSAARMATP